MTLTQKHVRDYVRALGGTFRKTEWGDYRLKFGDAEYHSDSLDDCVETARVMQGSNPARDYAETVLPETMITVRRLSTTPVLLDAWNGDTAFIDPHEHEVTLRNYDQWHTLVRWITHDPSGSKVLAAWNTLCSLPFGQESRVRFIGDRIIVEEKTA